MGSKNVKHERSVVSAQTILSRVAKRTQCGRNDLLNAKRGKGVDNTARAIAMKLCQERGGMKLTEMAKLFNVTSDSTVSRTITGFNKLLLSDRKLEKIFNSIDQDLTP